MNTNTKTNSMDIRAKLSTLWIVIMFNMLAADVLGLHIPGVLEEMGEFAGETPITQLMLFGAVMMEIAIAMIFLSRVLKYRANRWANIIASVITIVYIVGGGSTYPHYIFFAAIQIVCLVLIIGYVWQWPNPKA